MVNVPMSSKELFLVFLEVLIEVDSLVVPGYGKAHRDELNNKTCIERDNK